MKRASIETVLTPNAASFRGASLGRAGTGATVNTSGPFHLVKIRIDQGGYDKGGAYWGLGEQLWGYCDETGTVTGYFRAPDRTSAIARLRSRYVGAKVKGKQS